MRRGSTTARPADTLIFLYARSYDEKEATKRDAYFSSRTRANIEPDGDEPACALSHPLCSPERSTMSRIGYR
jgi:hypothetical protein